jgi:hypothetical protein
MTKPKFVGPVRPPSHEAQTVAWFDHHSRKLSELATCSLEDAEEFPSDPLLRGLAGQLRQQMKVFDEQRRRLRKLFTRRRPSSGELEMVLPDFVAAIGGMQRVREVVAFVRATQVDPKLPPEAKRERFILLKQRAPLGVALGLPPFPGHAASSSASDEP